MNPVRDDAATTTCAVCGTAFAAQGRQRHCSTRCRQQAWRRRRAAPAEPVVARSDTVYACPSCDARYLGEQRCDECNTHNAAGLDRAARARAVTSPWQ